MNPPAEIKNLNQEMIYDLIRYLDMFAGIGGFRAGLTRAGGFQCVGHCEIDRASNNITGHVIKAIGRNLWAVDEELKSGAAS